MRILRHPLFYCLAWLLVIGLSLAAGYFSSVLLDTQFNIRQELPFTARWIVWMPLTPLALVLAEKMSFADNKPGKFLLYHFTIYLLLLAIHVFAASAVAKIINEVLGHQAAYTTILRKCAITGVFYDFLVYGVIVLLLSGGQHYLALQSEKLKTVMLERSLTESRLQFLKQQLQPHFLFNAHHSIITLIKMGEKEKAASMLGKLSDLMRTALRDADGQVVPLQQEIGALKLYVDIQKVRFEDRMQVEYAVDEAAGNALVPGLILQPLVENSIKHGVERAVGKSTIAITAREDGEMLTLSVKDTCAASAPEQEIKNGTGLTNSIERLNRLYGAAARLQMMPHSTNGRNGMEVMITIPLKYAV